MERVGDANTRRNNVPKAPPLPAPRPFQGVKHAALKIIGLPSRPPSPQMIRSESRLSAGLGTLNRFATIGVSQNATASHRTGLEIKTLSINEQGTHALLGGREIFKTVKVEHGLCVEERNLRTTIRSTPNQASGEIRKVYSIDIADVAWAKGDCGDYVAAATSSGKIILYDLGHASLQGTLLHEHARQVHRVTFNPHRGNLLLSGSQDGTVRLWDIRDARTYASTIQSKRKYSGASDGVRDVKWSPTDGVDFGFCTDSGWIQRWDMRNLKLPKIKIPAHSTACTSIDWHPDGKHVVSAGVDKMLRIWDFSSTRKHKPTWECRTPYSISNARWRSPCESSMQQDHGARMCTQIATAYDQEHPVVHIWDLRRTALPFREFYPYATAPTDLLWHSQDLFWSVGREGIFLQTDIHHTAKTIDRRNLQAVAISPTGFTSFATQRRHPQTMTRHGSLPKLQTKRSPSMSQSPEFSLLSRSWADESLDHSFLTVETRRSSYSKGSTRYSSATATPPSGLPSHRPIIKLDDILLHRQSFTPLQSAHQGLNPLQDLPLTFRVLARTYSHVVTNKSTLKLQHIIESAFESCVTTAKMARQHRLAQTWDFIAYTTSRHIEKRLSAYRAREYARGAPRSNIARAVKLLLERSRSPTTSPAISPASMRPVTSIAQALAGIDTNSNMTTPLAGPIPIRRLDDQYAVPRLPDPEVDKDIALLPPSLAGHEGVSLLAEVKVAQQAGHEGVSLPAEVNVNRQALTQENLQAIQSQRSTPMLIEGKQIRPWSTHSKPILNLGDAEERHTNARPPLLKHDSDESFSFLVGSNSSQETSLPSSFDNRRASLVQEHPTRPLIRVSSEHEEMPRTYDCEPPDLYMSPTTLSKQEFLTDLQSVTQTLHQGMVIDRSALKLPEVLELQASAQLDVEAEEAFKLSEMLNQLINYYTCDSPGAQTAAQLLLTLVPLLPHDTELSVEVIDASLSPYIDPLATNNHMNGNLQHVLEGAFRHILNAGMNPLQLESILSAYHEQLIATQLFCNAASIRRLAYPALPAVYEYGLGDDNLTWSCGKCKKRLSTHDGQLRCEHCSTVQAFCAFCLCQDSPYQKHMGGGLITVCLHCNHSLHPDCASEWYVSMHGHGCPTEGCLCVCVV